MLELNNAEDRIESNDKTETDTQSEAAAMTNTATERRENNRRIVCKKRQSIEKVIILGSRVSSKCKELIGNPQDS